MHIVIIHLQTAFNECKGFSLLHLREYRQFGQYKTKYALCVTCHSYHITVHDFRKLFATQTYKNLSITFVLCLPPPPSQAASKAKFTHMHSRSKPPTYIQYIHTLSHTSVQKDRAQSRSLSLSHTHAHTHTHTDTVIQCMMTKTKHCQVKATCSRSCVIVHILTKKYKGRIWKKNACKCTDTHVKCTYVKEANGWR